MRRGRGLLVALAVAPAPVQAGHWVIEPAALSVVQLDQTAAQGFAQRTLPRISAGLAYELWPGVQAGLQGGVLAGRTRFGVLGGPTARRTHADVGLELRARWPRQGAGWCVQGAAGAGRMRLTHDPDHVVVSPTGGAIAVDLPPAAAWTRHVAAEVLHSFGTHAVGVRCAWRFYALDVADAAGIHRTSLRDAEAGVVLRVMRF